VTIFSSTNGGTPAGAFAARSCGHQLTLYDVYCMMLWFMGLAMKRMRVCE
jgi:hypothetical protein